MAIFIKIAKVEDNDERAEYIFGHAEMPDVQGRLKIAKATGEVILLEELPGDVENRAYLRAARKVGLAWREGKYPDKLCWAS